MALFFFLLIVDLFVCAFFFRLWFPYLIINLALIAMKMGKVGFFLFCKLAAIF